MWQTRIKKRVLKQIPRALQEKYEDLVTRINNLPRDKDPKDYKNVEQRGHLLRKGKLKGFWSYDLSKRYRLIADIDTSEGLVSIVDVLTHDDYKKYMGSRSDVPEARSR